MGCTMATSDSGVAGAIDRLLKDMTVYKYIGLDSKGRSHHYDPDAHEIVVCSTDRRGRGISDDDIERRIEPSPNSTGAWDYIQFVREEVEGLEWAETDAPETEPGAA